MKILVIGGGKMGMSHLALLSEYLGKANVALCDSKRSTRWLFKWLGYKTYATADAAISALGRVLHPFPMLPVQVNVSPATAMTEWILSAEPPANFTVDQDAELRAGGDKAAVVRYVKHTLDIDDIKKHVQGGKQCTRLALTFNNRVSFVLTENLDIKRVAALDILDSPESQGAADAAEKFDGDITLMCAEISQLLDALCSTQKSTSRQR